MQNPNGDTWLRRGTVATVLLVALIAAVVSYGHLYQLCITHGENRLNSALIPVATDGTVVSSSLLMLRAARMGLPTPGLARGMLVLSVSLTLCANAASGWGFALWGIALAAAPVVWFIGNVESVIGFGRKAQTVSARVSAKLPVPSIRQIQARIQVGQPKAKLIQSLVRASMNGSAETVEASDGR